MQLPRTLRCYRRPRTTEGAHSRLPPCRTSRRRPDDPGLRARPAGDAPADRERPAARDGLRRDLPAPRAPARATRTTPVGDAVQPLPSPHTGKGAAVSSRPRGRARCLSPCLLAFAGRQGVRGVRRLDAQPRPRAAGTQGSVVGAGSRSDQRRNGARRSLRAPHAPADYSVASASSESSSSTTSL